MDAKTQQILDDRSTTYWLRDAINACLRRDPVDAARDAEVLADLMQDRERGALGLPKEQKGRDSWPVVFIEGGIVQDVIILHRNGTVENHHVEYEVIDYDVFEDQDDAYIAEYWGNRSDQLHAYFRKNLKKEYAKFEECSAPKLPEPKPEPEPTTEEYLKSLLQDALPYMQCACGDSAFCTCHVAKSRAAIDKAEK